MSVRALKSLILAANLLLGASLLGAGGVTYIDFLRQEVPKPKNYGAPKAAKALSYDKMPPLAKYASIWKMRATPDDNVEKVVQEEEQEITKEARVLQIIRGLFRIVGIIWNRTNPLGSYAVLKLQTGKPRSQTVAPGESVSGAEVVEILRDKVVFEYQDVSVALEIQGGTYGYGRPGPAVLPKGRRVDAAVPHQPVPDTPPSRINAAQSFRGSRQIAANHWQIERTEMAYVQRNQKQLLNEYQPVPHIGRSGRQEGMEMKKVRPGSYAGQRGFHQGDIIKSINNIPLTNNDLSSIGKRLRGARTLRVLVLRRGRPVTLTFNVR